VVGSRGALLAMVVVVPRPSTTGRRRRADARHRQTPTRCELHSSFCEEEEEEEEEDMMMGKERTKGLVLFVQKYVRSWRTFCRQSLFRDLPFLHYEFALAFSSREKTTTTGGRRTKKKKKKKEKGRMMFFVIQKTKVLSSGIISSILKFSFRWSMLLSNPLLCSSQYY
tara:strand:- start:1581 stop:2084 length:504 start_codon:yes stop_codon:yes gene_type:complete